MSRNGVGKYRVIAHLRAGEGTEAFIVAVESPGTKGGGLAVLKRPKFGTDAEPELLDRFATEARLCQRLDHPNLAKLLDSGQDDDGPILVFEFLEGPSLARLRSRVARRGERIPLPIVLYIVKEIAKGLHYAHTLVDETGKAMKIVLRDISPDGISITYDGAVKLGEFGLATTVAWTAKSREDRLRGNVAYMAPEQTRAEFSLDARADLFALGVIFWELLTGKRFWEGVPEVDVLARLADDTPLPSARSVVPSVPEDVDALCTQALTKVRDERFDTAQDLLDALEKVSAKPELAATAKDLAALVSTHFDDERRKTSAAVEEARTTSDAAAALPVIGAPPPSDASPFVDAESDPKLRVGVAPAAEAPVKRVVEIIQVAPSSDRRFAYLMGALVLVVIGVAALVVFSSPKEEKKIESKPYVAPTRPSSPEEPPTASATPDPEEVTIEIRVSPSTAKLLVDGKESPGGAYRTRVLPAAFQHKIQAEAEGFETRNMTVAFDRARSIEIALTPVPTKPGTRRFEPKAPPPGPRPKPSAPAHPPDPDNP